MVSARPRERDSRMDETGSVIEWDTRMFTRGFPGKPTETY